MHFNFYSPTARIQRLIHWATGPQFGDVWLGGAFPAWIFCPKSVKQECQHEGWAGGHGKAMQSLCGAGQATASHGCFLVVVVKFRL